MDEWWDKLLTKGEVIAGEQSPCLRRRYCAQILLGGPSGFTTTGVNARYSKCCDDTCVRERTKALHGQMVERGGEVHAETMALIHFKINIQLDEAFFFLSGIETSTGKRLLGKDVYPCHTCALNIKAGGFSKVILRNEFGDPVILSIDQIIEVREWEWA